LEDFNAGAASQVLAKDERFKVFQTMTVEIIEFHD